MCGDYRSEGKKFVSGKGPQWERATYPAYILFVPALREVLPQNQEVPQFRPAGVCIQVHFRKDWIFPYAQCLGKVLMDKDWNRLNNLIIGTVNVQKIPEKSMLEEAGLPEACVLSVSASKSARITPLH